MMKEEKYLTIAMIGHKQVPSRKGGIEQVLTTICPMMVQKGHKVTCYNRFDEKEGDESYGENCHSDYQGVRLKEVWTWNKKGLAALTSSFSAAVCAAIGNYDIVHFHAEGPCAALWIPKLCGKRCIATVHGLDWQRDKWKHGFGSRYIKFGEKVLAKWADEVIVLSRGVQQYFRDTYQRDTVLIPNGVSRPSKKEADIITLKYGLRKDDYFCALSRLTEEKGLHYLIEAYLQLNTDKKLVIAGDSSDTDEYVQRLKEMAKDNRNIIFTGFVSGNLLDELYSNSYVYILPSNLEGMPLTLLEAMSYGNAVIGSDIPEIADVVEDKAVLFRKGDVDDLAGKMQYLADHPEIVENYRKQSSDFICGKYNWNDVAEATLQLYSGRKEEISFLWREQE